MTAPHIRECDKSVYYLDRDKVQEEALYDGFCCSATNLEDEAELILKVNRRRWEIEESFRILKSEFKARPVYLSRDDRITAHFMTCFLALYIFRILEKKTNERFTCEALTRTLREMRFLEISKEGFIPAYKRSERTDALHATFGFYTDYEIIKLADMRKIIRQSKKIGLFFCYDIHVKCLRSFQPSRVLSRNSTNSATKTCLFRTI